jgi:hypothetical protein
MKTKRKKLLILAAFSFKLGLAGGARGAVFPRRQSKLVAEFEPENWR